VLFSPTAKHALRATIHLAAREGNGPVLGRSIAEAEQIPKPFLSKILHDLRVKGLVKTTKGPGGGYELARPARDVKVMEVVEAIDGPLELTSTCILGLDECNEEAPCALHDSWHAFREQLQSSVIDLTLNDAAATLLRKRGGRIGD